MKYNYESVTHYLLDGKARETTALRFVKTSSTYGELGRRSAAIAASLPRLGFSKGDRVILIADNSPFWVQAYLGIMRAGLVSVPLPSNVSSNQLGYILDATEAKGVFVQHELVQAYGARFAGMHVVTDDKVGAVPGVASLQTLDALCAGSMSHTPPQASVDPDDLAALMFTSGSTGTPRGVMISHANIIANTESIIEYLNLTASDRMMVVLPFHYCYGASLLHTHLRVGGELVVDPRFLYPEMVLQNMIRSECTGFAGVPSHFQILLRNSSLRKKRFPHLRHVQQAGGCLAPHFISELQEVLPGTDVFIMYGQTEATARLSYLPPNLLSSKTGSIGKGIPGVQLQVLNEAGGHVRPGEAGEIVASGDNVARGYWRDEAETANTFRNGRLYTGDLATIDEEGFIYIVDRAKDFLKVRGERISCRYLEEQLLEFGELVEAAVIGVPDDILGEAVKAFVVPRSHCDSGLKERLAQFCKSRMLSHCVPMEFSVLPTLPKNSSGKLLRPLLRVF